jgi:hypothetical protein
VTGDSKLLITSAKKLDNYIPAYSDSLTLYEFKNDQARAYSLVKTTNNTLTMSLSHEILVEEYILGYV